MRRLLRVLTAPVEQQGLLVHWSIWRRAHQAIARRGHIAARARARPAPTVPELATRPARPEAYPLPIALSDADWAQVQRLLPPPAPVGRPPRDARAVLAGVLWILGTGAAWRELPTAFGAWQTAYRRYRDWCATGLWPQLAHALRNPDGVTAEVSL